MTDNNKPLKYKSDNKRKIIVISIAVIAVLLIAGAALYFFFGRNNTANTETTTSKKEGSLVQTDDELFASYMKSNGNIPTNLKYLNGYGRAFSYELTDGDLNALYIWEDRSFKWTRNGESHTTDDLDTKYRENFIQASSLYFIDDEIYLTYFIPGDIMSLQETGVLKLDENTGTFNKIYSFKPEDVGIPSKTGTTGVFNFTTFTIPIPIEGTFYSFFEVLSVYESEGKAERIIAVCEMTPEGPKEITNRMFEGTPDEFATFEASYTTFNQSEIYFSTDYFLARFNPNMEGIEILIDTNAGGLSEVYASLRDLAYDNGRLYFTDHHTLYSLGEDGTGLKTETQLWPDDDTHTAAYLGDHFSVFNGNIYFTQDYNAPIKILDVNTGDVKDFATVSSSHPDYDMNIYAMYIGSEGLDLTIWYYHEYERRSEYKLFDKYYTEYIDISFDGTVGEPYEQGEWS